MRLQMRVISFNFSGPSRATQTPAARVARGEAYTPKASVSAATPTHRSDDITQHVRHHKRPSIMSDGGHHSAHPLRHTHTPYPLHPRGLTQQPSGFASRHLADACMPIARAPSRCPTPLRDFGFCRNRRRRSRCRLECEIALHPVPPPNPCSPSRPSCKRTPNGCAAPGRAMRTCARAPRPMLTSASARAARGPPPLRLRRPPRPPR